MKSKFKLVVFLGLISFLTVATTMESFAAVSGSTSIPVLSSISLEPGTYRNLFLGETLQFTAIGTYSDGTTADISSQVKWSISNTTDVSISESGLLTVISEGNAASSAGPGGPSGPGEVNFILTAGLSGINSQSVNLKVLTSEGPSAYLQNNGNAENSNQSIYAHNTNQSGVKVTDGGVFTLSNSTITTTGDATFGGDGSSYGLNAAVLATSGAKIKLTDCIITSSGSYANGAFAYGRGSLVELYNVKILSRQSHGVDCTYNGTIIIEDAFIQTYPEMGGAALSNDTGDGDVYAARVVAITEGHGSPGFYAIGAGSIFEIKDSRLLAKTGEGGLLTTGATVFVDNSTLIGGSTGISCSGGSVFTMTGGAITSTGGPAFLIENGPGGGRQGGMAGDMEGGGRSGGPGGGGPGDGPGGGAQGPGLTSGGQPGEGPGGPGMAQLGSGPMAEGMRGPDGEAAANVPTTNKSQLTVKGGVAINSSNGNLIEVRESSEAFFTAEDQELKGNIIVFENCGLDLTLHNSKLTGKIEGASLTIEAGSQWNVTGDSTLTGLSIKDGVSGKTVKNITGNGHIVYYDKDLSKELGGKTYSLVKGGKLRPR